jgi:hypothetical protein
MNEAHIKRRKLKNGYQITCRQNLWKVIAPNQQIAEREAFHYWFQYFCDGEYDALHS